MIQGKLRGRRILIEGAADASTLRNKGFLGRNVGEKLSLDLVTSFVLLLRKKIEVRLHDDSLSVGQIEEIMSEEERKMAIAFDFLKVKGMRPLIRNGKLYALEKNVIVHRDDEFVYFPIGRKRSFLLAITDAERNCIVYSINRLNLKGRTRKGIDGGERDSRDSIDILQRRGMKVASGLKFGSEFRIYEGSSKHARYLMTTGNGLQARELVAKVRIAQSVRKTYIQAVVDSRTEEYVFFEVKWIRQ